MLDGGQGVQKHLALVPALAIGVCRAVLSVRGSGVLRGVLRAEKRDMASIATGEPDLSPDFVAF